MENLKQRLENDYVIIKKRLKRIEICKDIEIYNGLVERQRNIRLAMDELDRIEDLASSITNNVLQISDGYTARKTVLEDMASHLKRSLVIWL